MSKFIYTHSSKTPPTFQVWEKENKGIVGLNWNAINKARQQLALPLHDRETLYTNGKTGEIK